MSEITLESYSKLLYIANQLNRRHRTLVDDFYDPRNQILQSRLNLYSEDLEAILPWLLDLQLPPSLYERGRQIAYVPNHALCDLSHHAVEYGFIWGPIRKEDIPCRFWVKGREGKTLRTRANSEMTPLSNIIFIDSVDQQIIRSLLRDLELTEELFG